MYRQLLYFSIELNGQDGIAETSAGWPRRLGRQEDGVEVWQDSVGWSRHRRAHARMAWHAIASYKIYMRRNYAALELAHGISAEFFDDCRSHIADLFLLFLDWIFLMPPSLFILFGNRPRWVFMFGIRFSMMNIKLFYLVILLGGDFLKHLFKRGYFFKIQLFNVV